MSTSEVALPTARAPRGRKSARKAPSNVVPSSSEARYALVASGASDGLWDWDLASGRIHVSARCKGILGYAEADLPADGPSKWWFDQVHPEDLSRLRAELDVFLNEPCHGPGIGSTPFRSEHRLRHVQGHYCWVLCRAAVLRDDSGRAIRLAGSITDLTDRKMAERLCRDAFHDSLTGLANRSMLMDRIRHCIQRAARRSDYQFAILLLDMDRLRVINDSLGPLAGDELLAAVSARLSVCVRGLDLVSRPEGPAGTETRLEKVDPGAVARLGGDEFVLVLDGIGDGTGAIRVAHRVQQALARPFTLVGQEVFCSASIGVALGHGQYTSPEDLLRDADTALFHAKAAGPGRYQLFDHEQHAALMAKWRTENELRSAIERGQLRLHFQPVVSLEGNEVLELEALVRWEHPERGMVPPIQFIPLAEETGLIVPLGNWVLTESCRQLRRWQDELPAEAIVPVAVNVSARQLVEGNLVEKVAMAARDAGIEPSLLRLEITESAVMENIEAALPILEGLRDLGVQLHMDDFGTGYSSLASLHRLPIDALKIDRSFVSKMATDTLSASIVQTIITLANRLELQVIAEGVEDAGQAEWLRRAGVGCAQGYFYSKPVACDGATRLLTAGTALPLVA